MGYNTSAAKNAFQQTLHNTNQSTKNPADQSERISYGVISDVNQDTSQVKVRMYKPDGTTGDEISPGYLPILNPLSQIHLNYGLLREGLVVRIFWKGKLEPQTALIEVIGDETLTFLHKTPEQNSIEIGPFRIFS